MAGQVLVFIEHDGKEVSNITPQLVTRGREQADKLKVPLNAVVLGDQIDDIVQSVSKMDFDSVLVARNKDLAVYNPELYAVTLAKIFKDAAPKVVLFGDTYITREIAPAIAIKAGVPFFSCCSSLAFSDNKLLTAHPKYGGTIHVRAEVEPVPHIVIASMLSSPDLPKTESKRTPNIVSLEVIVPTQDLRTKVVEIVRGAAGGVDISKADILISGGRGICVQENISAIRELAKLLGGTVSCSRPLTDLGWLPMECLVGMSGKTVSPNVYLALGISGAPQHLMAMAGSKCIIAINKDVNAPIFRVAHYAVIGDLKELLPAIIEEARKAKAAGKAS